MKTFLRPRSEIKSRPPLNHVSEREHSNEV